MESLVPHVALVCEMACSYAILHTKAGEGSHFQSCRQFYCNKELLQEHNDLDQSVDHPRSWISPW